MEVEVCSLLLDQCLLPSFRSRCSHLLVLKTTFQQMEATNKKVADLWAVRKCIEYHKIESELSI